MVSTQHTNLSDSTTTTRLNSLPSAGFFPGLCIYPHPDPVPFPLGSTWDYCLEHSCFLLGNCIVLRSSHCPRIPSFLMAHHAHFPPTQYHSNCNFQIALISGGMPFLPISCILTTFIAIAHFDLFNNMFLN